MKKTLIFTCALLISILSVAQDAVTAGKIAKNYVSSDYNRNSLTLVGLNFGENLSDRIYQNFSKLEIPDKFYSNPLQNKTIATGTDRASVSDMFNQLDPTVISKWLNQNKVGQQILSTWFNRQQDGSFNVEVLKERGLFNANDNEFMIASASKRGESSLMDMGLQLVNQTYLIAFDFTNNMTMTQYYDKSEVEAAKRTMNGFKTSLKTYLFKLDFNDSVAAVFFQDYWVGENTPDKQARIDAFENAEFPFVLVSKQMNEITSAQYNEGQPMAPKKQLTEDELLDQLSKVAFENTITTIEKQVQSFRVKAMVSSVKPISAKIGKKEGLKFDQRYFVYENRQRNNGTLSSKRIGVVKSMTVADNRKVTSGQTKPSEFYQIAGGQVDNYGMFLEQHNDVGLNVFIGATAGGLSGINARAEYYISKVFGEFVKDGKSGKPLTSWKIYGEIGYGGDTYTVENFVDDFTFTHFSFGISKDFYPLSFLHWGPFVGYGVELGDWETNSDDEEIDTDFLEAGARVGVNLAHNIQLLGSATYYAKISSQIKDSKGEVLVDDFDYTGYFEDRMGLGISLGLRIMF